jgi:hypothetical protein
MCMTRTLSGLSYGAMMSFIFSKYVCNVSPFALSPNQMMVAKRRCEGVCRILCERTDGVLQMES